MHIFMAVIPVLKDITKKLNVNRAHISETKDF